MLQLGNNIGHLSRGGQDGWGRAFCAGLQYAVDRGYDYGVHVEGDSLCRLDVVRVCEQMALGRVNTYSVPVRGTRQRELCWVETGLMFFNVSFLAESKFIKKYDWLNAGSKKYPHTPEAVVHEMLGHELCYLDCRTTRDDVGQLTTDNVVDYDWITHAAPEVYDAFFEHNMPKVTA